MALGGLRYFTFSNMFGDVLQKLDMKPKAEKIPLNLNKEASFTVQLRDPNLPNIKYKLNRRLVVTEDGLHVIDPLTKKQVYFFPFTQIKTFRLNPIDPEEWQILFKGSERFLWYSFASPEADKIHESVLGIVENIVLDRNMFEAGDPSQ